MGTRGCFPLCKAFPLLRQYLPQGDLKWCNYMGCSESRSLKRAFGNRSVGKAMSGICPNFPPCSPSFPCGWGSENKQAAGHLGGYKWPAMPKHVLSCKYLTPTPSSSCWQLCSPSMRSHTEPAGRFSWERALVAPHCSSCHSPMFVPATWHRPRAPSGPHPVPLESLALKPALSFPAWRKRYCFQACMDRAVLGPAAAHAFLSHPNHAPPNSWLWGGTGYSGSVPRGLGWSLCLLLHALLLPAATSRTTSVLGRAAGQPRGPGGHVRFVPPALEGAETLRGVSHRPSAQHSFERVYVPSAS